MAVPNRLAVEGEQLIVHRFGTGSMGLASPRDLKLTTPLREQRKNLWARLHGFVNPPEPAAVRAVCVPPGARLILEDIPRSLQMALGVGLIELAILRRSHPSSALVTRSRCPAAIATQYVSSTDVRYCCKTFVRASRCG